MPPKLVKLPGGRTAVYKAILLENGNLLVPGRMAHDRDCVDWVEVAPGTSDYKRWFPVRSEEPDPRQHDDEYKRWKKEVEDGEVYKVWKAKKDKEDQEVIEASPEDSQAPAVSPPDTSETVND